MKSKSTYQTIHDYIASGYPCLNVVSSEEVRVLQEVEKLCADGIGSVSKKERYACWRWNILQGVHRQAADGKSIEVRRNDMADPITDAFEQFKTLDNRTVLVLLDFHMVLADKSIGLVRMMKEAMSHGKQNHKHIIIIGCTLQLPPELEREITPVEFKLPDRNALSEIMNGIADGVGLRIKSDEIEPILDAASGQTTTEAENSFALSVVESGKIDPQIVFREKCEAVKKGGLLEVINTDISLDDVGGNDEVKSWISKRSSAFTKEARAYGLPMPKGFMQVGIPGCSKTLIAKATAKTLGVPLLKLDGGKIFGSLVGQSEANIRSVISTCEAVAPCVVLIDEIEKAFAGSKSSGSTDGGTASRVFGSFLQWLNDKTAPVFVVATANDITQLPPEFLRKGRFDEIFFNDLPTEQERVEIWRIQIKKWGRKSNKFDLEALAKVTPEWTGAEIEGLFKEGLYAAFDKGKEPDTELLLELARETVPLSKTMSAQVQSLREWAVGKTRRSSKVKAQTLETGRRIA